MSIMGLTLLAIAKIFSEVAVQFCIHTSNIYESSSCPASMLSYMFMILDILIGM